MISQHQKPLVSGFGAKTEPSEILENINLADKTVIITGAARGLGQKYAIEFAKLGSKVVFADISSCDETEDKIKTMNRK